MMQCETLPQLTGLVSDMYRPGVRSTASIPARRGMKRLGSGTKSRKVTRKVFISPRLCSLLFAKPDIPLPRTGILRSPRNEKRLDVIGNAICL